jgi:general secretion pathway protein K
MNERESGAILLFVLAMLAVLVPLAVAGIRTVQVDLSGAARYRNGVQAESLALSGLHLARFVLARDLERDTERAVFVDHPGEEWAGSDLSQSDWMPDLVTGSVKIEIRDEQSGFPVNKLVDENGTMREDYVLSFVHLLQGPLFELENEEAMLLTAAIVDWMDEDDSVRVENSAEKAFYQEAGRECGPRNGPLESVEELRLVRWMEDEIYFGREGRPGLRDLVSVQDFDLVNINTADIFILQALASDIDQDSALDLARAMVDYRSDSWHQEFLDRSDWYRDVAAVGAGFVSFPQGKTSSSLFSARVTGRVGGVERTAWGLFSRADRFGEDAADQDVVVLERVEIR